jgi:hypothetical protein
VVVVVVVDEPSVAPELVVVRVEPVPSVEMAVQPARSRAATPASKTFVVYEVITPNLCYLSDRYGSPASQHPLNEINSFTG